MIRYSEDCPCCLGEYCQTHHLEPCECETFERHVDENGVVHLDCVYDPDYETRLE